MCTLAPRYCLRNPQDCRACTLRDFKHEAQKDRHLCLKQSLPRGAAGAARHPCARTRGDPSPTLLVRTSFAVKLRSPPPMSARCCSLVNCITSNRPRSPTSVTAPEISLAGRATPILCLSNFSAWEAQPKASSVSQTISPASTCPSVVTPRL